MGFRFRYRAKIFPGVHLNLSSKGISSISIGGRGATMNVGRGGRQRVTLGIPGTGLSFTHTFNPNKVAGGKGSTPGQDYSYLDNADWNSLLSSVEQPLYDAPTGATENELVIPPEAVWSDASLGGIKALIERAYEQRNEMSTEVAEIETELRDALESERRNSVWYLKWFKRKAIEEAQAKARSLSEVLGEAKEQLASSYVPIDWTMDADLQARWDWFLLSMRSLAGTKNAILHAHAKQAIDRVVERSWASQNVDLAPAKLIFSRPDYFPAHSGSKVREVPCFVSDTGFAVYFFPSFVLVERQGKFGLVRPEALQLDGLHFTQLMDEGPGPAGAEVVDYTWKYVNKNGQPDRRFSNNYQIPIYGLQVVKVRADESFAEDFYFARDGDELLKWRAVSQWHAASQRAASQGNADVLPGRWFFFHNDEVEALRAVSLNEVFDKEQSEPGVGFLFRDEAYLVVISRNLCPGVNLRVPYTFDLYIDGILLQLVDGHPEDCYSPDTNLFSFYLRDVGNKMTMDRLMDGAKTFSFRAYQNGRQITARSRELPEELYTALRDKLPTERLEQSIGGVMLPL